MHLTPTTWALLLVAAASAACSDPGPTECIVDDDASAAAASSDRCELVRVTGGPFTDLTALAGLRRDITLHIERADALTTTAGLPTIRNVHVGAGLPSLTEVVLTVDEEIGIGSNPATTISLHYTAFAPPPKGGERSLALRGLATGSVAIAFDDKEPLYLVAVDDVPGDFTIAATPGLPPVERLQWSRSVPASLSVLQQFGRPSVYANFHLLSEEARPIVADYVRWLHEESPGTTVALTDENSEPLELSEIGVTE